jgi:hypothetical protein
MFTSLFMHGGFFHLFGNMIFLFLTGSVIECFWGRARFLSLYFVSGVVATLTFQVFHSDSYTPLVGASGAIAGLMGAFLIGHPKTKVRFGYIVWFFFIPKMGTFTVPAWGALIAWIVQQVVFAFVGLAGGGDGVAYWAHVGGFAVGAAAAFGMKHFDLFPDYAKELLADEEPAPPPLAVAAQPLSKPRSAWVEEARAANAGAAQAAATASQPAEVESIAIPGFDGGAWTGQTSGASAYGEDESFFEPDDEEVSIPLGLEVEPPTADASGLPDDIIPEGEMHRALPEAERYPRQDPEHSIPMPGFDVGPTLPEPPGGFDDES